MFVYLMFWPINTLFKACTAVMHYEQSEQTKSNLYQQFKNKEL